MLTSATVTIGEPAGTTPVLGLATSVEVEDKESVWVRVVGVAGAVKVLSKDGENFCSSCL